jgi:hypothetical protein
MVGFIFGGNTGETAGSLKRKRETIEALQKQIMGQQPKNVYEGIAAVMKGATAGIGKYRLDKAEKEGAADFTNNVFNPLMGGSPFVPAAMGNAMPKADGAGNITATPSTFAPVDILGPSSGGNPELMALLADPATRAKLPAGMRNNNPGNIKFVGQKVPGIVGPSDNTDQGDPQAVFDTPESGMNAMFSLAKRKYDGGKKTTNQLIAGNMGWTPGNTQAAANVARTMGIGPDDDINMNDPAMASKFLRALIVQEHGKSGNLYSEDMIRSSIGGREVASLDPSIGMTPMPVEQGAALPDPAQPQTAAAAIEAVSPTQQPGSLSDEVAAFQQTPEYDSQFPGRAQASPQARMESPFIPPEFRGSKQIMGATDGIVPALMGGRPATEQQMAQAQQASQQQQAPQQTAQQAPQGANALGLDPRLIAALSNPFIAPEQKAVLQAMAEQQMQEAATARQMEMKRNDPAYRLDLEKSQLELNSLRNPKPEWDFINGKDGSVFRADKRAGTMEQVYGGKPQVYRPLSPQEAQAYGLPPGGNYQIGPDNKVSKIGGEGTTVNIDQKSEGAFDKKLAEKQAESFDTMATEGLNARADLAVIDELGGLLQGTGGTLDGLAGRLSSYGIGGEGMSDLQAADALINKLIPSQRAPGSGSMSDRDVEMFKASLPSLWNAPGGNTKILGVMRGLTEYKQAQGEIADQVLMGEMTRQEARRALRELPNPLDAFKKGAGAKGAAPVVIDGYQIEEVE